MKINMDAPILSMDGEAISVENRPMTLGFVAVESLLRERKGDDMSIGNKVTRFDLAVRLSRGGEVDLISEDISLIKAGIGIHFTALVVGQAVALLEGKPNPLIPED